MINYAYSNEFREKNGGKILHYLKNYNTPIPMIHNIILNDIINLIEATRYHHFSQRLELYDTPYAHNPRYEDRRERTVIRVVYKGHDIIIAITDRITLFNTSKSDTDGLALDRTFTLSTYTNIIDLLDQMV